MSLRPAAGPLVLATLLTAATHRGVAQELPAQWMPLMAGVTQEPTHERPSVPSWLPPVAAAVIPGTGQLLLGQNRGALYLAVEGVLLVRYFSFYDEGRQESERYRDLAFDVARAPFEPVIRDTTFEYFEQMGKFIESGPFDADPGPGFAPPTDDRTYNGGVWLLARETFFADPDSVPDVDSPEYRRALDFYRSRAVGPNFLWTWRNAGLEQDLFRGSIAQSDENFRRATLQLGLLLANHVISAVDAFISSRLGAGDRVSVRSAVAPGSSGDAWRWSAAVDVAF